MTSTKVPIVSARRVHTDLCSDENLMMNKVSAWERELGFDINLKQLMEGFRDLYLLAKVNKHRTFQHRLFHRANVTNIHFS